MSARGDTCQLNQSGLTLAVFVRYSAISTDQPSTVFCSRLKLMPNSTLGRAMHQGTITVPPAFVTPATHSPN